MTKARLSDTGATVERWVPHRSAAALAAAMVLAMVLFPGDAVAATENGDAAELSASPMPHPAPNRAQGGVPPAETAEAETTDTEGERNAAALAPVPRARPGAEAPTEVVGVPDVAALNAEVGKALREAHLDEVSTDPLPADPPEAPEVALAATETPDGGSSGPASLRGAVERQAPLDAAAPVAAASPPVRGTAAQPFKEEEPIIVPPRRALLEPEPDPTEEDYALAPAARVDIRMLHQSRPLPGIDRSEAPGLRQASLETHLPLDRAALVGVIDFTLGRQALLRLPNGRFERLAVGQEIEGWRVTAIGRDAMRLHRGEESLTLVLVSR
ncbi:MAG: hypothetical protein AAGG06_02045 [Pseudomonadota bacterium]